MYKDINLHKMKLVQHHDSTNALLFHSIRNVQLYQNLQKNTPLSR